MSKDHVSENVRRMRQIQRKCKQKQREEETSAPIPVKALWKSQKYESVPSKLAQLLQVPTLAISLFYTHFSKSIIDGFVIFRRSQKILDQDLQIFSVLTRGLVFHWLLKHRVLNHLTLRGDRPSLMSITDKSFLSKQTINQSDQRPAPMYVIFRH